MTEGGLRAGLAEAFGVFLLVFVGGSAICMDYYTASLQSHQAIGTVGIAFAHGLALMIGVYCSAGISGGHLNPSITFGLFTIGKCSGSRMAVYILFQLIGGVLGAIAVMGLFAAYRSDAPYLGTPHFVTEGDGAISAIKAVGIEALFTFVLAMVVLLTAVDRGRSARQMGGLAIGMTVAMIGMIGGFTGGSMNPARYLGPALVSGSSTVLSQLPVYLIGPIIGSVIACLIYKFLLETKDETQPA
jgi:aquaporin Z